MLRSYFVVVVPFLTSRQSLYSDRVHILLPLRRNAAIRCTNHNVYVLCANVQNTWRLQMDRFISNCCTGWRWMPGQWVPSTGNRFHGRCWYFNNSQIVVERIEIGNNKLNIRTSNRKMLIIFCVPRSLQLKCIVVCLALQRGGAVLCGLLHHHWEWSISRISRKSKHCGPGHHSLLL